MPPGMMPSMAAGIPPGATLTIPGGYLAQGTERQVCHSTAHHMPIIPPPTVEKTQQRDPTSLLEPGLVFFLSYKVELRVKQ